MNNQKILPMHASLASVSWNLLLLLATMISDQDIFSSATPYIKPKCLLSIFMLQNAFLSTQWNLDIATVVLLSFAQLWLTRKNFLYKKTP